MLRGFLLASIVSFSLSVQANENLSQLINCQLLESDSSRLSCYDEVMEMLFKPLKPAEKVNSGSESQTTTSAQKQEVLFGKSQTEIQQDINKKYQIESLDEITAKVLDAKKTQRKEYILQLDNGQVWHQKGTASGWYVKKNDVVKISKGLVGSYYMSLNGRKKRVRAVRVK